MFNYSTALLRTTAIAAGLFATVAAAQWNYRYAKLGDFNHHTYLEQHELPILAHGPTDPAPAPDGRTIALAARGWIWLLDLQTRVATQLTDGPDVDARPRWSTDGKRLAIVRDTGSDTSIVIIEVESGKEQVIDTPTIELDPEFSADGKDLFYTSGVGDGLSLWQRHLASGADQRLTDLHQVERNARRVAGGTGLLYLHGDGAHRVLRLRDFVAGTDAIAHAETLTYHLTADTHPRERLIVYSAPIDNDYHLWTLDLDDPRVRHRLTDGDSFALTPAFSADGRQIYFVDLDDDRQFRLRRMSTHGGAAQTMEIERWDYRAPTGTLALTIADQSGGPVTARVSITRKDGHPVAFDEDATFFDSQTGRHYFYPAGEATLQLPEGEYDVVVARGPMSPLATRSVSVRADRVANERVTMVPRWNAAAAGYVSVDHHVHLNGDGHHRADHADALRLMAGEDLDQMTPMSWNRWERRIDAPLVGQETSSDGRIVRQAQEVRSHFHGHIGLNGVEQPFAPWFFGPSNPTLGDPDLTNGDVIDFAESHEGVFPTYVHPIGTDEDPFSDLVGHRVPLEFVSDAVLAERIGLEIVCAWTSPLGNTHLWYRLLNIGRPVAAMSGTDGWVDFHRTPAMGTGRTYVRVASAEVDSAAVLEAAANGRSFVTTGPALVFTMGDDARPGDVVEAGAHPWRATLVTTVAIDIVELVVNGRVVAQFDGVGAGETRQYEGQVDLPDGGWVAIRAYASEPVADAWPTMHARPFAHSSPIWIESVGSTEAAARAAAAADLIRAVEVAQARAREAYGAVPTPRLHERFDAARARLQAMIEE